MYQAVANLALDGEWLGNQLFRLDTKSDRFPDGLSKVEWRVPTNGIHSIWERKAGGYYSALLRMARGQSRRGTDHPCATIHDHHCKGILTMSVSKSKLLLMFDFD
jgi:hypothetical protein